MSKKFKRYYRDAVVVEGQLCKCSPEVAAFINRSDWNEDYQERKRRSPVTRDSRTNFDPLASSRECSLDQLLANGGMPLVGCTDSFEDEYLQRMTDRNRLGILCKILPTLTDEEQLLLSSVTDCISSREFEKRYGIPRKTFAYRRDKLLERLRMEIINAEKNEKATRGREA